MGRLALYLILGIGVALSSTVSSSADESAKSSPADTTPYSRPAVPADTAAPAPKAKQAPAAPTGPTSLMRQDDTVVNNTNTNLQNTDTFDDGETSIAINPNNHNEIVISAFSGTWSSYPSYSPIWLSMDAGRTWTKEFTITQPFGVPGTSGCPCDQTYDFGTLATGNNPELHRPLRLIVGAQHLYRRYLQPSPRQQLGLLDDGQWKPVACNQSILN